MRKKIAAGNWKMFKTYDEALTLIKALHTKDIPADVECIVAPPYLYLKDFVDTTSQNQRLKISAQNCHEAAEGAYTGEISAPMLRSIGVPYVIIGHSERREQHAETSEVLKQKIRIALDNGIDPIFCCGEPLSIRKENGHIAYVTRQLTESLAGFSEAAVRRITIAYEPIWAIGTGETASPEQAQEMHAAIRAHLAVLFGEKLAESTPILYGGSVKPGNAREIFAKPDVDGGLVGGASLDADSFYQIITAF
jgi:triosephosphate isomerase